MPHESGFACRRLVIGKVSEYGTACSAPGAAPHRAEAAENFCRATLPLPVAAERKYRRLSPGSMFANQQPGDVRTF